MAHSHKIMAKVGSELSQALNKPMQNLLWLLIIAKVAKFSQIWSHCLLQHSPDNVHGSNNRTRSRRIRYSALTFFNVLCCHCCSMEEDIWISSALTPPPFSWSRPTDGRADGGEQFASQTWLNMKCKLILSLVARRRVHFVLFTKLFYYSVQKYTHTGVGHGGAIAVKRT